MAKAVVSAVAVASATLAIVAPTGCTSFGGAPPLEDGGTEGIEAGGDASGDGEAGVAGPACALTCSGRTGACRSYDFATGCSEDIDLGGDQGKAACKGGRLVVDASGTLDATATLTLRPLLTNVAHVAFEATVDEWIESTNAARRRLLQITSGGNVLATVRASTRSGSVDLQLCNGSAVCTAVPRRAEKGKPFYVTFTVDPGGNGRLEMDCNLAGTSTAKSGAMIDQSFQVVFGDNDGNPIRGSFDDLTVWFEPAP